METATRVRPASEVLAEVSALLDGIDPDRSLLSDSERLALVISARRVSGRLAALAATVASEAAAAQASDRQTGVPLTSWLPATERATRRETFRLIAQGADLARFGDLQAAALAGTVGVEQATTIAAVLGRLPDDLGAVQLGQAEAAMLAYAAEFDAVGLARLSRRLVELVDPEGADEREAARLERELRTARAERCLGFYPDGHGSVIIKGSLPTVDAEPLVRLVDAYAHQLKRQAADSHDRLDRLADSVSPAQRRADGLCALVAAHQLDALAPACGGDRPRIVVTLDYDKLRRQCIDAGVLESGVPISAGELRRLACDAEILPAVLGGPSEILDVGRAQRLVTPAIRLALVLRDGGCVFPGCDGPPSVCHAHHSTPWWAGGTTDLGSLLLVCPHHHNLVEPSRDGPSDMRWEARIGADGVPEVLPPVYVDRSRTPRRHQRHKPPPTG